MNDADNMFGETFAHHGRVGKKENNLRWIPSHHSCSRTSPAAELSCTKPQLVVDLRQSAVSMPALQNFTVCQRLPKQSTKNSQHTLRKTKAHGPSPDRHLYLLKRFREIQSAQALPTPRFLPTDGPKTSIPRHRCAAFPLSSPPTC